jgi:hypothetical protein
LKGGYTKVGLSELTGCPTEIVYLEVSYKILNY